MTDKKIINKKMKGKNNFEANEKQKVFNFYFQTRLEITKRFEILLSLNFKFDRIYGIQIGFSASVIFADLSEMLSDPPLTLL